MKGPLPKSAEQRRREGNPSRRPLPEPVKIGGKLTEAERVPPRWLPARAKALWFEVVPALADAELLTAADLPAFAVGLTAYADWHAARSTIRREGRYVLGSRKQKRPHPAVAVEQQARADF